MSETKQCTAQKSADEQALRIARKLCEDAYELTQDEWRIEFARRLRTEWGKAQEPFAWQVVNKYGNIARNGFTYKRSNDLVICADADWPANAPHRSIPLYATSIAQELAAQVARIAELEREYQETCEDCDHGIRGGSPCQSCGGVGKVTYKALYEATTQHVKELKQRLTAIAAACPMCNGQGWYPDYDRRGDPQQVQCEACLGTGLTLSLRAAEPDFNPVGLGTQFGKLIEANDKAEPPSCVNRTGYETPNDCEEHGYCRSPHNKPISGLLVSSEKQGKVCQLLDDNKDKDDAYVLVKLAILANALELECASLRTVADAAKAFAPHWK